PAVHGPSAAPTPPALRQAAQPNNRLDAEEPRPAATPAATTHNRHTEPPAQAAATAGPANRRHTEPRALVPAPPSTIHPRRCDASSSAAHDPAASTAIATRGIVNHARGRTAAPLPIASNPEPAPRVPSTPAPKGPRHRAETC